MQRKTIRVVDLDGTISDDRWRRWMIDATLEDSDPKKYYIYHMSCGNDPVINRHIVDESPHPVVFVTARHDYSRYETREWLKVHKFKYKALIMRDNMDHTPSVELKRKVVQGFKIMFNIEKAFDDHKGIIDMYKSIGVEGVLVK